jgi:hypothetical protein
MVTFIVVISYATMKGTQYKRLHYIISVHYLVYNGVLSLLNLYKEVKTEEGEI